MTKIILVAAAVLAVGWLVNSARAQGEIHSADEINAVLEECVDRQQRAPGIVIGFIDDKGTHVFARGVKTKGKPGAVDGDTIFEIGSVTKAFTGVLLQEMVTSGEVKLDDPIARYLPKDVKAPARDGNEITLLHLATQRSGLPRLPDNFQIKNAANPYADYTVAQLYQFLSAHKLARDPDAKYEYSNLGLGLLGHLLALKAGTSYEAAVSNRICAPLLMRDTRITLSPELIARLASGHNQAGIPVSNWDIPALAGAGALRSSANDMLKFLAANLALTNTPLNDVLKQSHAARASAGGGQRIGLGWHINPNGIVWHNGATGGYHAFLGFHPDKRIGVIVLANSENDIDDLGLHILGEVPSLAKIKVPKQRAVATIDTSVYENYTGRYQLAPAVFFTITREGDRLLAQLTGQGPYEVFPESATEFFYTVVDAQLTFAKNSAGKVTHLILHQNGLDQKAVKVP